MIEPRTCVREGCHNPVTSKDPRARYCSDACKSAQWRADTGYRLTATRTACQTPKKTGGPSGLTLSWAKTLQRVSAALQQEGYDAEDAETIARTILRNALSDAQRTRLDARDA